MKEIPALTYSEITYGEAIGEITLLAVPHIGASLITMGGNFVGVVFISKLGAQSLAASNLAYSIQNWFMTTVTSSISTGTNSAAKKIGENKEAEVGGVLQKNWIVNLAFSAPIIGCLLASEPLLLHLHQDPSVVALTTQYFRGFVWGIPGMFILTTNRQIALATKNPKVALCFVTFYQALDTGLSYCLVFGKAHLPELGFAGLSYSNSISVWITVLLFTLYMACAPSFREFGITTLHTKNFWSELKEIALSSLSMGAKVAVELGTMVGASLMIGAMSADQQAAQEAAFQYIFIISPLMFGMMDVASKRVTSAYGAKNSSNIIKYGNAGVLLGVLSSATCLLFFVTIPTLLLRAFIDQNNTDNTEILNTARMLLLINGIGQLADSVRTILLGCLMGVADRVTPTIYIILTLIGVFIPLSYALGFPANMQAEGVMTARDISIALGALMLSYRWLAKNHDTPEAQPSINIESAPREPEAGVTEITPLRPEKRNSANRWTSVANYFRSGSSDYSSTTSINSSPDEHQPDSSASKCFIM